MYLKANEWAKANNLHCNTVYNWLRQGIMPVPFIKTKSGTYLVSTEGKDATDKPKEQVKNEIKVAIYCRVSSHDKKDDLMRQVERCKVYCNSNDMPSYVVYKEIASGMNDNRVQLYRMFDEDYDVIVIENKGRLTRFGFNYIGYFLKQKNITLIEINKADTNEDDLLKDFISVITSFCCRLYGMRRGKNKAKKITDVVQSTN